MRLINLEEQKFGRLTVTKRVENDNHGKARWECRCSCGNITTVASSNLKTGQIQSCGCFQRERMSQRSKTHGMTGTPTYRTWRNMVNRCTYAKHEHFPRYGGRGIKICKRWMKFESFLADMGERPAGMTIERKNQDGDYEPTNCIWATQKDQMRNTRSSRLISFNGQTKTLAQWSEDLKINYAVLLARLDKLGWSIERTFTTPIKKGKNNG